MFRFILYDFNSTMVRLKGPIVCFNFIFMIFQFHYGTIKSNSSSNSLLNELKFQFHYGTIKRLIRRFLLSQSSLISIPLWYD